jgi:hypothetical protein
MEHRLPSNERFSSPLNFFHVLSREWFGTRKIFVDPVLLLHRFTPFRTLGSPHHAQALYAWLMECRANHLEGSFLNEVKDHPFSQNFQTLFFLFAEYCLLKARHPEWVDAWDLWEHLRLGGGKLPCESIAWVRFPQTSFFLEQWETLLGAKTDLKSWIQGPALRKKHGWPAKHCASAFARLHRWAPDLKFYWMPELAWLTPGIPGLVTAHTLTSLQYFDDIFGYLWDQSPKNEILSHLCPDDFLRRTLIDHVLPDKLSGLPAWTQNLSRPWQALPGANAHSDPDGVPDGFLDALLDESHFWTSILAELEFEGTPNARTVMVAGIPRWLPSEQELQTVSTLMNLNLSPTFWMPGLRSESMILVSDFSGNLR